jgi:hypothetical protein
MAPTGVRLRFRLDDMLKAGFVDDDFIEHLSLAATVFRSRLPGGGRDSCSAWAPDGAYPRGPANDRDPWAGVTRFLRRFGLGLWVNLLTASEH